MQVPTFDQMHPDEQSENPCWSGYTGDEPLPQLCGEYNDKWNKDSGIKQPVFHGRG